MAELPANEAPGKLLAGQAGRRWIWWAAIPILVAVLPKLDLAVGELFWRPADGFFLARCWPVLGLYHGTRWLIAGFAISLVTTLFASYLPGSALRVTRARLWFAAAALVLGPGLITNFILKDHWGRPRPSQIENFGGRGHYVPPWQPSRQCDRNCAFVSAHAAAGFFVITGAWLWPRSRRRWLIVGVAVGAVVGLGRIAQGGHFLSDVLGALALVWLTNAALYRWMAARGWLPPFTE